MTTKERLRRVCLRAARSVQIPSSVPPRQLLRLALMREAQEEQVRLTGPGEEVRDMAAYEALAALKVAAYYSHVEVAARIRRYSTSNLMALAA